MAKLIGSRYASSLFEAGLDLDKIEKFYEELNFIENVFGSEPKLFQIFIHPRISKDEKKSLVEEIFGHRISKEVLNFLFIIIDKRREKNLFKIIEEYEFIFNEYKEIVNVVAITAVPMREKSKEKLKKVLQDKFNKEIQLSNEVDESIIGGVLLRMDNSIIDSTLKSRLKDMEMAIQNVSL